jgi:RNA exonuclease
MGTAKSGDSELIRVTLLDYFSGRILVDNLVDPNVPMLHLNTRYSGVRPIDMDVARRSGTCFYGRDSAREAILKFVGPSTLVVGHSAQHDLTALRWIHPNVIDTYLLESDLNDAVEKESSAAISSTSESLTPLDVKIQDNAGSRRKRPKGSGRLSLKTLSKVKLGREIQTGRNGHDSVEDALAARDLVHAYLNFYGAAE